MEMTITDWHDFFFAVICATGSLLGLLFVAISISISKIVTSTGLSKAALQPLFLLLTILVSSIYFLIPAQPLWALGLEVLISAGLIGLVMLLNDISVYKNTDKAKRKRYLSNLFFNLLSPLCVLFSGIILLRYGTMGVYVMVPAIIVSFVQAITVSWALMVEIHLHDSNERWADNVKPT